MEMPKRRRRYYVNIGCWTHLGSYVWHQHRTFIFYNFHSIYLPTVDNNEIPSTYTHCSFPPENTMGREPEKIEMQNFHRLGVRKSSKQLKSYIGSK